MGAHRLRNPVQHYDWGSPSVIPELLGLPNPDGRPWAELWLGAHERAPSEVRVGSDWRSLAERIDADPQAWVGAASVLPFLLKLLAVERPLSLQVHPDATRAAAGFAREEAAGLDRAAPERHYRDPNGKHEMVCALSPFWVLCGLREPEHQRALCAELALGELDALAAAATHRDALAGLAGVLSLPAPRGRTLAEKVATATREAAARRPEEPAFAWARELAARHPGDPAALAPLFLEARVLAPGEALYLPPGELHGYLAGSAIELMSSSDNVVRGGLTSKPVDVAELRAVASRAPRPPEILRAEAGSDAVDRWPVRCDAFALSRLALRGGDALEIRTRRLPEILLCTSGEARLEEPGAAPLPLARGDAVFVDARSEGYRVVGEALLHRASVPDAAPARSPASP